MSIIFFLGCLVHKSEVSFLEPISERTRISNGEIVGTCQVASMLDIEEGLLMRLAFDIQEIQYERQEGIRYEKDVWKSQFGNEVLHLGLSIGTWTALSFAAYHLQKEQNTNIPEFVVPSIVAGLGVFESVLLVQHFYGFTKREDERSEEIMHPERIASDNSLKETIYSRIEFGDTVVRKEIPSTSRILNLILPHQNLSSPKGELYLSTMMKRNLICSVDIEDTDFWRKNLDTQYQQLYGATSDIDMKQLIDAVGYGLSYREKYQREEPLESLCHAYQKAFTKQSLPLAHIDELKGTGLFEAVVNASKTQLKTCKKLRKKIAGSIQIHSKKAIQDRDFERVEQLLATNLLSMSKQKKIRSDLERKVKNSIGALLKRFQFEEALSVTEYLNEKAQAQQQDKIGDFCTQLVLVKLKPHLYEYFHTEKGRDLISCMEDSAAHHRYISKKIQSIQRSLSKKQWQQALRVSHAVYNFLTTTNSHYPFLSFEEFISKIEERDFDSIHPLDREEDKEEVDINALINLSLIAYRLHNDTPKPESDEDSYDTEDDFDELQSRLFLNDWGGINEKILRTIRKSYQRRVERWVNQAIAKKQPKEFLQMISFIHDENKQSDLKRKFIRVFERQIMVEIRKKNLPNIYAILGGIHSIIRDGHDLYSSEKQELLYVEWQELYARSCPVIREKHMKDLQSALGTISSVGSQIQSLYRKMAHAEQRNLSRSVDMLQDQINDKMMELEELEHTQTAIIRSNLEELVELMEMMQGFEESGIDTYKLSGFTSRDLYYDLRRLDNRY